MASLADCAVPWPVSGSWQPVYLRITQQSLSASLMTYQSPSGMPSTGVQVLSSNPSRQGLVIYNSGSQALLIGYGYPPTRSGFTLKITAFSLQSTILPCFTGPLYALWDASASLSGSSALFTELTS